MNFSQNKLTCLICAICRRYMKCLQALDELELENELTQKEAESRSNEEREKMEEKKNLVDEMTAQYFEFKKGVAKQAVNSRYLEKL